MDHNTIHDHEQELPLGSHTFDINCNKGAQEAYTRMNIPLMNNAQVSNPHDYKHILNMVLLIVQQRLLTAKKDIEGLILLLNQEMVAKDYLMSKVNDLEEDLHVTKRKNKENLQQAILAEKERVTKVQWDRDEFFGKVMEIESRLILEESGRIHSESEIFATSAERELLLQELNGKTRHLEKLEKLLKEVEMKSKTDLKVLLKEVKFLRKSQESIREVLNHCIRENDEIEAEQLAQSDGLPGKCFSENSTISIVDDLEGTYCDMRKLLAETVADNARLRRQMNAILRCALKGTIQLQKERKEEVPSGNKLVRWFSQK